MWEARRRLDPDLLAAEALWDEALLEPVQELDAHLRNLSFHLFRRYIRSLRDTRYRASVQPVWADTERVIWADVDPEAGDSFADALSATVARFNSALRPHLCN